MNIKALVVDDSRSMRRIVMKGLQKAQVAEWDFDEAEDGEDALAKFDPEVYDMLFIDWNMPKMNGIDVVRTFNTRPFDGLKRHSANLCGSMRLALCLACSAGGRFAG